MAEDLAREAPLGDNNQIRSYNGEEGLRAEKEQRHAQENVNVFKKEGASGVNSSGETEREREVETNQMAAG